MAGIAGYLGTAEHRDILPSMLRKLNHRGNAFEEFLEDGDIRVAICGSDPVRQKHFTDVDQGVTVVLDGHIYNTRQLQEKLHEKGLQTLYKTEAELIAKIYQAYGTSATRHLRGIFSIVIYDFQRNLVMLSRDHMGVKPLFYTTTPSGSFVFASEIKALLEHPGVHAAPDMMMIDAYLSLGFCPGPQSLFKRIHSLPAGHNLIWNPGLHIHIESFWQWDGARSSDVTRNDSDKTIQTKFDRLFDVAVHAKSADSFGRYGVAISPDVSAQAVAVSAMKSNNKPFKLYSAHFKEDDASATENESFAKQIGVSHEAITVLPSDISLLPEIIWSLDQPVADPLILSRYLLSRAASHDVRELLSAEGSDDVMGGHPLHRRIVNAYQRPKMQYALLKPYASYAPLRMLEKLSQSFFPMGSGRIGSRSRQRLVAFIRAMHKGDVDQQYLALSGIFNRFEKEKLYTDDLDPFMETYNDRSHDQGIYASFLNSVHGLERRQGVTENIVNGFERVSNLANLNIRLPYTYAPFAAFMKTVPDHLKIQPDQSKLLLRNYIAKATKGRIHAGADTHIKPFPFASFTSSPSLREMIGSCLSEDSIRRRGLFDQMAVKQLITQAKENDVLACRQMFSLLSLEVWFRIFIDHEKGWISH